MSMFIADVLFVLQVVCALIFGVEQYRSTLKTTKGMCITLFFFWEGFLSMNLVLAWQAHTAQPSRVTLQTLIIYGLWTLLITANIVLFLWKRIPWNSSDTMNMILGGGAIVFIPLTGIMLGKGIDDPWIKGWLAIFCKATPQLLLAREIWRQGGGGPPAGTVWFGHVTVISRLCQLGFSIAEAGWDESRLASAFSEALNELSWVVVTIVWLRCRTSAAP